MSIVEDFHRERVAKAVPLSEERLEELRSDPRIGTDDLHLGLLATVDAWRAANAKLQRAVEGDGDSREFTQVAHWRDRAEAAERRYEGLMDRSMEQAKLTNDVLAQRDAIARELNRRAAVKRDFAIVRADVWRGGGPKSWEAASDELRRLGEQGYAVVSVVPLANPNSTGDVVWTLERCESPSVLR